MELFDIVDARGVPTGETIPREEAHARGIRHRTAHVWVVRGGARREVLLQKRSANKDSFPGLYDTSAAGHIQAGDAPLESALRELGEELGIRAAPEELTFAGTFRIRYDEVFHGRPFHDDEVSFVYVYQRPVDAERLSLQAEEVEAVAWFDMEEVLTECRRGSDRFCVPVGGLEVLKRYLESETAR